MFRKFAWLVCILAACSSSCSSASAPASPTSSTSSSGPTGPPPPPNVIGIFPVGGSTQGGTTITITGTNLVAGAAVTIGGTPAANVRLLDSQHITATTAQHAPGSADVVVTDGGQTIWLTAAFTFIGFGTSPSASLESALGQDYQQVFRTQINHPAFFDNSTCGGSQVTSTAYFKSGTSSTLLYLATSADGKTVLNHLQRTVVTPAGTFRMLVVLVGYAETVNQSNAALFAPAQDQINRDHAAFAASKGYGAPIVSFQNTNVMIDHSEIADPRTPNGVAAALAQHGTSTDGFDFLVSINIDPAASDGGLSWPGTHPAFIYMGNAFRWSGLLTVDGFTNIATAVYHHEVAHHWGWSPTHDWSTCYVAGPFHFLVPPVLFGWEDTNGNGVPEILDAAAYQ